MNIQAILTEKFNDAFEKALGQKFDSIIKISNRPQFGDYQANGVMMAAKASKSNPREVAQKIIDNVDLDDICEKLEIAGPGFINIFLKQDFLSVNVEVLQQDPNLAIARNQDQTIVVDYSAPNVAKEMHVGHLRSTVIGDAMVKILEFLGNKVIRANHIGDWGTQFGMLIAHLEDLEKQGISNDELALTDFEAFYRDAKKRYDEDEEFALTARSYVVKLQGGDEKCLTLWKKLVTITMEQNQLNYNRLNVSLTPKDIMGESLYNPMLADVVEKLLEQKVAEIDDGAAIVRLNEFKNKDGEPLGVIIRKRDGGFIYTTTDIAAAKYRYETLKANRAIYFIDSRQSQHLQQAWTIARKGKFVPDEFSLEHFAFGMMLGKDGKPFKTRAGGTVKLSDLLDEAEVRARKLISEKNPDLSTEELETIVDAVAIGSVKYSDLSKNRTTDYIFDWDQMLSFEGNTAPYIQYAYTRIKSIFAKAGLDFETLSGKIIIENDKERALALKLLQFEEILNVVSKDGMINLLCSYLFELATLFSSFYENCPILNQDNEEIKTSRLLLASATAKTLQQGLALLGIKTIEKM